MSAIITNKLRIFNAQQFIESVKLSASPWAPSQQYNKNDSIIYHKNIYINIGESGTSNGVSGPTHLVGALDDGDITWLYYTASHYNNVYLGIGNSIPWFDDSNPPTPSDSVSGAFDVINNLTSIKKIEPNTVTLCAPRVDWKSGTIYEMYDDYRSESIIPNGYVLVSHDNEYRVYKCINNSKWTVGSVGVSKVPSTVKPTIKDLDKPFDTNDGYTWKYMYSIYLFDALQYLTKDYIPVKFLTVEPTTDTASVAVSNPDILQWTVKENAMDVNKSGRIEHVRILPDDLSDPDALVTTHGGGGGYNKKITIAKGTNELLSDTVNYEWSSGLSGLTTTGLNYNGYGIFVITTTTGDSGGAWRTLTSGSLTSASFKFTLSGSFSTSELAGATSYVIAPIVYLDDGNGQNFSAFADVVNGEVHSIKIVNKGRGYTIIGSTRVALNPLGLSLDINNAGGEVAEPSVICQARSIISPEHGHGFNPVEELGGYYAMISMKLEYDEQNSMNISMFPVDGDESVFRQVSIISDPVDADTQLIAVKDKYRGPNHPEYSTNPGTTVSTGTGNVDLRTLCILPGLGRVLYIENRQPVSRAIDQIEDIKVVFEF